MVNSNYYGMVTSDADLGTSLFIRTVHPSFTWTYNSSPAFSKKSLTFLPLLFFLLVPCWIEDNYNPQLNVFMCL